MTQNTAAGFVLLLAGVMPLSTRAAPGDVTLTLHVTGAVAGKGQMIASVFDSEATYMRVALITLTSAVDSEGSALFEFELSGPGDYAISVIYDENGNGDLDTGLFRIPREKFGFSNNAKGRFGPAKWSAARFLVNDTHAQLSIELDTARR